MILHAQKVIEEAQFALDQLRGIDVQVWDEISHVLRGCTGTFILTGVGKSGYIAMKVAATFSSYGHRSFFLHPLEAMHGDSGIVRDGDVIIAFSYSGTTKELLTCLRHLQKEARVSIIGVTRSPSSVLAMLSDCILPITINEEGCPLNLAPMASTTAMLVAGDALAAILASFSELTRKDFARFHPSGTLGLELTPVTTCAVTDVDFVVPQSTPWQDVLKQIGSTGKGVVAVVDEQGLLCGSITDGDVRRFFSTHDPSVEICALHFMHTEPKVVHYTENLNVALKIMEAHKITNVFMVDDHGVPLGIVHIHDILSL